MEFDEILSIISVYHPLRRVVVCLCRPYGQVREARVIMDRETGRSKGVPPRQLKCTLKACSICSIVETYLKQG